MLLVGILDNHRILCRIIVVIFSFFDRIVSLANCKFYKVERYI